MLFRSKVLIITTGSKASDIQREAELLPGRKGKLPTHIVGASGSSALKRVRPRQRNGFASVATIDMEIGIQR